MISKFIAFGILISAISYGSALNCNLCYGSLNSDCAGNDAESSMVQYCNGKTNLLNLFHVDEYDYIEISCMTATFTDNNFLSKGIGRGCMAAPAFLDICKYLIDSGIVSQCSLCNTDRCN